MMQPLTYSPNTVQYAEQRLWSEYLLAVSRCQGTEVKYQNAWRDHVTMPGNGSQARWEQLGVAWEVARQQVDAAKLAWKRAAYPPNGYRVSEDEQSS